MKETTTINISGIIFHIDIDAFEKLKNYFAQLKSKFGVNDEAKEIINDIELRIAELLQDRLSDKKEVVSLEDITEVIQIMGEPEDIDAEQASDPHEEEPQKSKTTKQLYRDPDNQMLGGVCSGIGYYFGIDPVIVRALTFVFSVFYGVGVLLYIILWAFIPKALTTAQKLEMRGEPVTAQNIKNSVRGSYESVRSSEFYKNTRQGINSGVSGLGEVLKFILKVIIIIIGVGLLISAISGIVAIVNLMFLDMPWVHLDAESQGFFIPSMETFISNKLTFIIFSLALFLLAIIPVMMILFLGVKMIFNFTTNNKAIGLSALGIWLLSLAAVITISVSFASNFSSMGESSEIIELKSIQSEVLYIDLNHDEPAIERNVDGFKFDTGIKGGVIYHKPDFDVERSQTGNYELVMRKIARGHDRQNAANIATQIEYHFSQKDSLLIMDKYFESPLKYVGRIQDLDITLRVPEGKKVYFYKDIYPIVHDIDNIENISDYHMMGKIWIMQPEGLIEYKSNSAEN